uniref:transposase n=1 Tax=Nitrospira cf. moscoviensis SBR1015 TaxID=96242 RepID=UPI00117D2DCC|nr:transposase [Nitrospira cf. moscoviensis SBR1015]
MTYSQAVSCRKKFWGSMNDSKTSRNGWWKQALASEITTHLGYTPHAHSPSKSDPARNGSSPKPVQTKQGSINLAAPHDQAGTSW